METTQYGSRCGKHFARHNHCKSPGWQTQDLCFLVLGKHKTWRKFRVQSLAPMLEYFFLFNLCQTMTCPFGNAMSGLDLLCNLLTDEENNIGSKQKQKQH